MMLSQQFQNFSQKISVVKSVVNINIGGKLTAPIV